MCVPRNHHDGPGETSARGPQNPGPSTATHDSSKATGKYDRAVTDVSALLRSYRQSAGKAQTVCSAYCALWIKSPMMSSLSCWCKRRRADTLDDRVKQKKANDGTDNFNWFLSMLMSWICLISTSDHFIPRRSNGFIPYRYPCPSLIFNSIRALFREVRVHVCLKSLFKHSVRSLVCHVRENIEPSFKLSFFRFRVYVCWDFTANECLTYVTL